MKFKQRGFTLIELLIVVAIIAILVIFVGVIGGFIMGNAWYTEDSVGQELRLHHPEVESVLTSTRNIWSYSEILVQEGVQRKTYYLDTDIFWNYEFHEGQDD